MQLNHFNSTTREFTHTAEAIPNPRKEGAYLSQAFTTSDPLPELPAGFAAVRSGDDTEWLLVEDHRGQAWSTASKSPINIDALGSLPAGITDQEPGEYDSWEGDQWLTDTAAKLKAVRDIVSNTVRVAFNSSIKVPAAAFNTTWNGGMESALAIDGAVRLAEQIGATTIMLFDSANAEHVVSIETGKQVAVAVGVDYQTKLARKQQLLRDIAIADEEQLKGISW